MRLGDAEGDAHVVERLGDVGQIDGRVDGAGQQRFPTKQNGRKRDDDRGGAADRVTYRCASHKHTATVAAYSTNDISPEYTLTVRRVSSDDDRRRDGDKRCCSRCRTAKSRAPRTASGP
jgi:hypothetical protein